MLWAWSFHLDGLFSLSHCDSSILWRLRSDSSLPHSSSLEPCPGWACQGNLSVLGCFFSRFTKTGRLQVKPQWLHPSPCLHYMAYAELCSFMVTPYHSLPVPAGEAAFPSGPSHCLALFLGVFLFSFLPFGLLWPPVTLEVLASPGWCTVAKNTLSRVLLFVSSFSPLPENSRYS